MDQPRVYQPCWPLRPYVKNITMLDIDFTKGQKSTSRAIPRGVPVMLIPYRKGVCMQTDIDTCFKPMRPVLIGQTTRTVTATLAGIGALMYVVFQPTGMHNLIRNNMQELTNNWELSLENFTWIREGCFFERLKDAQTDNVRLAIIEQMLLKRLLRVPVRQDIDAEIVKFINHKGGNLCIMEASRYFKISMRTLERHFNQYLGIGPKQYADIIRFRVIMEFIKTNPHATFLDLTSLGGFTDQSHFIKNVRKITKNSPETYFSFDRSIEDIILSFA